VRGFFGIQPRSQPHCKVTGSGAGYWPVFLGKGLGTARPFATTSPAKTTAATAYYPKGGKASRKPPLRRRPGGTRLIFRRRRGDALANLQKGYESRGGGHDGGEQNSSERRAASAGAIRFALTDSTVIKVSPMQCRCARRRPGARSAFGSPDIDKGRICLDPWPTGGFQILPRSPERDFAGMAAPPELPPHGGRGSRS